MSESAKRRKLRHNGAGARQNGLINFSDPGAARISTASAFVLQTEELLKEEKVDYATSFAGVDNLLFQLKTTIESIEPHDSRPLRDATAKLQKKHSIVVPYPDPKPPKDVSYKVEYAKPAQCNVVGSYVMKTVVKSQTSWGVDMVIQMPDDMFQAKDYMNMRYFYRRAYYIAYVAAHVRKEMDAEMDLSFELLNENPLLPVLVLRSKSAPTSTSAAIRIIPCCSEEVFPRPKLAASSSCIRGASEDDANAQQPATPFYNSTLKAEGLFVQYLRLLTQAKNDCASFAESCMLGRIWLQQRGFGSSVSNGGFGHFEWALLTALLLRMGGRNGTAALSSSLSAPELFKAMVQFLATNKFLDKPYLFGTAMEDRSAVRESGPVMYDPVRGFNLLYKTSPWSGSLLQLFAKSTTELLSDDAADNFEPTFIRRADASLQLYDSLFELKSPEWTKLGGARDRRGLNWELGFKAQQTLKKAYGNRAQLIHIQQPPRSAWQLNASCKTESSGVKVGIIFDPANMSRQMDHGPSAEEQMEAAKFRQFWGEKAELRRFKDGSILECIEWSSKRPVEISQEIARYILPRHVGIPSENLQFYGNELDHLLGFSYLDKTAFDTVRSNFQTFEHDLRNLEDMPLQIRQLSPISPSARYTSIKAPLPGFQDWVEPVDVLLFFEASSRWPENLIAIQETKIDFLLDFDRRLKAAHDNITTYLGREDRDVGIENLAYLDVIYDNGAAYRLRLHCDLEETLLERQARSTILDPFTREKAEDALSRFNYLYTTLPLHSQTIATFCTRFHSLSQTIRLVKHWFSSHKLSGHFSDVLIELFVLHVFLQPYPLPLPSSPATGLIRTLTFLSRWDWRDDPLIVDSSDALDHADRSAIHRDLEAARKRDPNMNHTVLFVATSHNHSGLAYTRYGPSRLIASRMTRLAKAACKLTRNEETLDSESLFQPSLSDYDVLIHLSPKTLRTVLRDAASDATSHRPSQFKNLDVRTGRVPLPLRVRPGDVLLNELRRVYADTLIFFRGAGEEEEDSVVGAIWDPRLQEKQKFRAGLPYNFSRMPAEEGDVVEVNRTAVLAEIARIGGEMIKKIEEVE